MARAPIAPGVRTEFVFDNLKSGLWRQHRNYLAARQRREPFRANVNVDRHPGLRTRLQIN
jgi:hypothetical protein